MRFILPALLTMLLHLKYASTLPTTDLSPRVTSSLHACSIFVQRWDDNSFDVAYYSAAPTSDFTWDYPYQTNFWNQYSDEDQSGTSGEQLVPWQVGSNVLYITNVRDPSATDHDDPGELSFVWGSDAWDSSSCLVDPVGANWATGGSTNTQCVWQCDVDTAS